MSHTISSILISLWYSNTNLRIENVNYEMDRIRFTRICQMRNDYRICKINLVIKLLIGKITLERFISECLEIVKKYFDCKILKSKTKYLILRGNSYSIEDRLSLLK